MRGSHLAFIVTACLPCCAATAPDTAQLAKLLQPYRKYEVLQFSAKRFNPIQSAYLAWIDSRVKVGRGLDEMNRELKTADLVFEEPEYADPNEDIFKSHAGYLAPLTQKAVGASLKALVLSVYTGSCNLDDTLVVYRQTPIRRVASLRAENTYSHGYGLREAAAGNGVRALLGSAWVASNCTSNWNGNRFRIDRIGVSGVQHVLNRGVTAYGGEDVKITVAESLVTFEYATLSGDAEVLVRDAIERYRVQAGSAIRQAPIALSFGGFIHEWLSMSDIEASRWSSPSAASWHRASAIRFNGWDWKYAASCPGSVPSREIEIKPDDSSATAVFQISGTTIESMRMESVSDRRSAGCVEFDITNDMTHLFGEPSK